MRQGAVVGDAERSVEGDVEPGRGGGCGIGAVTDNQLIDNYLDTPHRAF